MRNEPKNCRHCGKVIPGAENTPPNQYLIRQYCGRKCSTDAARQARRGQIGKYSNKNWNH